MLKAVLSRPIYNIEQKMEYLEYESSRLGISDVIDENQHLSILRRYFERICEKEMQYDKDLLEMSKDEAIDTLSSVKIKRTASRGVFLSLMKAYGKWAVRQNKIDNCKNLESLTPVNIANSRFILERMIGSPEHLNEIIYYGAAGEEGESRQIVAELIIRLLFEGMKLDELRELEKDSVDKNGKVVLKSGECQLGDKTLSLWKKCVQLVCFENWPRGNSKSTTETKRALVINNYLFRHIDEDRGHKKLNKDVPCSRTFFTTKITNVFREYSSKTSKRVKANPSEIRMSGLFYKMLLDERNGIEVTPEYVFSVFKKTYKTKDELRIKSYNLLGDYYDWKIAFKHNVIARSDNE